jgi:hypothetical protein
MALQIGWISCALANEYSCQSSKQAQPLDLRWLTNLSQFITINVKGLAQTMTLRFPNT